MAAGNFTIGDLITFRYNKIGTSDPTPAVVVIAPLFENTVHGVNVRYLPVGNMRKLILATIDKDFRKIKEIQQLIDRSVLKSKLRDDIVESALKNPQVFYYSYIKPILKVDAYRQYKPVLMTNIRKIQDKAKMLTAVRRVR